MGQGVGRGVVLGLVLGSGWSGVWGLGVGVEIVVRASCSHVALGEGARALLVALLGSVVRGAGWA